MISLELLAGCRPDGVLEAGTNSSLPCSRGRSHGVGTLASRIRGGTSLGTSSCGPDLRRCERGEHGDTALSTSRAVGQRAGRRSQRVADVRLIGLSERFRDGTDALLDLNLDIADGEFLVLVGPSGCGKTTALRADRRSRRHRLRRAKFASGVGWLQRCPAVEAGHRDGFPKLRPVPAYDSAQEPRDRPQAARGVQAGAGDEGARNRPRLSASRSTSSAGRQSCPVVGLDGLAPTPPTRALSRRLDGQRNARAIADRQASTRIPSDSAVTCSSMSVLWWEYEGS